MCIAINKPENVLIPHTYLEQSFLHNDDGAGFMYAQDGQLHIEKGFMTFDSFMEAYTPHEEKPCVLHFRIKTHGDVNQDNTHPFQVGKDLGFVHNGIIGKVDCSSDKKKSDTQHFNAQYLNVLYRQDSRFIYKPVFKDLIGEFIGHSKLVFLNNKGQSTIVNEKLGKWDNGVWYSNTSYMPRPAPVAAKPYVPMQQGNLTPPTGHTVFAMGSDVYVNHPRLRGRGTIKYFTGNSMVGVLMAGDREVSLLPMQCLSLYVDPHANPFKIEDYVIRKTDEEMVMGIVTGTSKDSVWVQWLDDYNNPVGNITVLKAQYLEHWDYPLGV